MAEFLNLAANGGARYEAITGMLVACPFCGNEFSDEIFDMMREAEEMIFCPVCGTPIYKEQFYVPESMRYSY